MNFKLNFYFLFSFFSFLTFNLYAFSFDKPDHVYINDYLKIHKEFVTELCQKNDPDKFNELFKNYSGEGFFLPLTEDDKINFAAINEALPELKLKIDWLRATIKTLENSKNLPDYSLELKELNNQIEKLLKLKEQFDKKWVEKKKITKANRIELNNLRTIFDKLILKIPYLLHYKFPIDYLDLRKEYETYKNGKKAKLPRMAQKIYILRKIIEDGAPTESPKNYFSPTDVYFRTTLNTIAISIQKRYETLPEDLRFDLNFLIKKLETKSKKEKELEKLQNWLSKTELQLNYYKKIIALKEQSHLDEIKETTNKIIQANGELKNFVQEKKKGIYNFWTKQSELNQILYVMENILYNEVGDLDGSSALERRSVAQIILNRYHEKSFTEILSNDPMYTFVQEINKSQQKSFPWLNLFFKQGEFSFTYFYIPANIKMYCPDVNLQGENSRKLNLTIALETLRSPDPSFKALRYFSRISMTGRIDMSSVWYDYTTVPEMPGNKIDENLLPNLKKRYQENVYQYFYTFKDRGNNPFEVVEIDKKTYVHSLLKDEKNQFYAYRNPHLFKYFEKKL
ncbi:MAG: hypothetical protein U0T83_02395 [Bacteriovoracaceae bacterium]